MSLLSLRREVKGEIFDYQLLISHLQDVKYPRSKIGRLLKAEEIIRIKKGLYTFGEMWRKEPVSLEIAANLIYGPSCISFEYALFRYGMIAERATTVTSLTIGRAKEFHTPIGTFRYHSIDPKKFGIGIEYIESPTGGGFFIASREKALADLLLRIKPHLSVSELEFFLIEEMRIDKDSLKSLDRNKLKEISAIYNNTSIDNLIKL